MKKYYETKIGKIIAEEFDSRVELMVFTNIMDKGIDNLKDVTEEEILQVEGNGLMTAEFVQALVRTSVRIAKECTPMEIFEYIRLHANFSPYPNEIHLYEDYFTDFGWSEICYACNVDEDESIISVYCIVEGEE